MAKVTEHRDKYKDTVVFICDVSPPRGTDTGELEAAVSLPADFLSVAYNPGRAVRASSVMVARWIAQTSGKNVLFTIATRDVNKLAAQSLLLGAAILGLENVVVLQGDPFTAAESTRVKAVNDFRTTEMLQSIGDMNRGFDYKGLRLRSPTDFCYGATIDLGNDRKKEISLVHHKALAGAQFFLLQPLFEPAVLKSFLAEYSDRYEELLQPVFCGVQVLTSSSVRFFGGPPRSLCEDLKKGRPGADIALGFINEYIANGFRSIYLVPPVIAGGKRDYDTARRVLESFPQ